MYRVDKTWAATLAMFLVAVPVPLARAEKEQLPPGVLARLGAPRLRPGPAVTAVAVAPDGKLAASAGTDQRIRLWDVKTGTEVRAFKAQEAPIRTLLFLTKGAKLLSSCDRGTMQLWDVAKGTALKTFKTPNKGRLTLVATRDGDAVFGRGPDGVIRRWEVSTGKEAEALATEQGNLTALALSRDGKRLAWGRPDGSVRVWDVGANEETQTLDGKPVVTGLAFTPDGKVLASANTAEYGVILHDVATGKELRRMGKDVVTQFTLSPSGKLLLLDMQRHPLTVWGAASGKQLRQVSPAAGFAGLLPAFLPDGNTLAVGTQGGLRFWDLARDKPIHDAEGQGKPVEDVCYTPDSKTLIARDILGKLHVWDVATGKKLGVVKGSMPGGSEAKPILAVTADSRTLVYLNADRSLRFWDLKAGRETRRLNEAVDDRSTLQALTPDGGKFAWIDHNGDFQVLNLATDAKPRKVPAQQGPPGGHRLAWSPNGQVLAVVGNTSLQVLDMAEGRSLIKMQFPRDVAGFSFAADSRTFACATDVIQIFETATGVQRQGLKRPAPGATSPALSPDRRLMAVTGDHNSIVVYNLVNGQELTRLDGHADGIAALAFAPDAKTLASASHDYTVLIWDVSELTKKAQPTGVARAADLDALWKDLQGKDAAKVHRAIWTMAGSAGKAEAYLKARLKPAPMATAKGIERMIADLDAEDFDKREQASQDLKGLRDQAIPAVRKALEKSTSLEQRRRLKEILAKATPIEQDKEGLATLRAMEVLELLGTKEARSVLQSLARGGPSAWQTLEAKATLERLARRMTKE
jgi:WD40 repeat protein